jgi:T5SS/PEP-CTERM-associated repeat protein
LIIGASGIGAVTIENGGTVSSTTSFIALNGGGNGSASVTGTGSTWTASSLNVGGTATGPGGTGSLTISSGGLVRVNGTTNVWANGTVDVQGGGTFNANDNFTIDDGVLTRASSGSFNLAASKTMTIQNGGRASFTGTYITAINAIYNVSGTGSTFEALSGGGISIGNGAQAHVTSGGLISSAGNLNIGINGSGISGNGTLTVDGTGSSLVSGGASNSWGQSGNTATVTFTNNAAGTLSGALDLGPTTTANTTAAVNVLSGADLSVGGNFTLAAAGGATTSATLNVQGSGSTFSQTGSSSIVVGHALLGAAAINIGTTTSGASFTTGTDETTINKTGVVTIGNGSNTGTFNANGNISANGGLLRRGSGSSFNLAAGKIMDVFNAGRASFTGGYTTASNAIYFVSGGVLETLSNDLVIGNGAQVSVDTGGLVSSARFFDIGTTGGDGTLSVTGNSSSVTAAGLGLNAWGNNGHAAHVTFSNNATGSFPGGITMVSSATAGTAADVNILSGADMTVSNLFLGFFGGGAATSATMTVDGAGSSVTQISNSMLSVGNSSTGSASLIVRNNALFTTSTNSIFVAPTGTLELNSGAVFDARGPMTMSGTFKFLGGTLHVDNYTGDLDNQGGTLAPGHSAGNTNVSGIYKQESPATLQIEIGGTTPGTTFDTLHVSGPTVLGGTLNVSLISDFIPSAGNTFPIIMATGGITGRFTSLVLPALSALVWQLDYQPTSLSLIVTIPGDYNHNGTVDAADYVVWRKTLGQIGNWFAADGNGNGIVDNGDFDVWRAHFGQAAGSGAGASASAAVPEPAALLLMLTGILTMIVRGHSFVPLTHSRVRHAELGPI